MNKEFAWFLGWLLTDGSITRPTYRNKGDETHIQFCLHVKDAELLEKIRTVIQTNATVKVYPLYKSPQSTLRVYDRKDICKSYSNIKHEIPDINGYERHFIRGLIEGDGCLHYRQNRNSFRINFINTDLKIVKWVSSMISSSLGIQYKEPRYKQQDHLYIIEWEGKVAKLIAWWLFHGDINNCCLNRKLQYYNTYVCPQIYDYDISLLIATDCIINNTNVQLKVAHYESLRWAHIIQKLLHIKTTPITVNKGQKKYYELYIHKNQIANTQDTT